MAFKLGDLVWAKLKGFPAWPGIIAEPPENVHVPKSKKKGGMCVFFFGTENYSWVEFSGLHSFDEHEESFSKYGKTALFLKAIDDLKEFRLNGGCIGGSSEVSQSEKEFDKLFKSSQSTPNLKEAGANDSVTTSDDPDAENGDKSNVSAENDTENEDNPLSPSSTLSNKRVRKAPSKLLENSENDSSKKFKPTPNRPNTSMSRVKSKRLQEKPEVMESKNCVNNSENSTKASSVKIGFLGLGAIGLPLAKSLVKAGFKVIVWNRTLEKCETFDDGNTSMAYTPGEVVNACDIIFSCMKDMEVVRHLLYGNGGVLSRINSSKSYVEMTSIDVQGSFEIQDAIKSRGGNYLNAMIIGTRSAAEDGQMVFLTSGDRSVYEECLPCFEAMGKNVLYFGSGANAVKMATVYSLMSGALTGALAEGLALADRCGLSAEKTMEILQATTHRGEFLKNRIGAIFQPSKETNIFPLQHLQNNIRAVGTLSEKLDEPVPVTATVNEMLKTAKKFGYATSDAAMVYIRSKF